MKPESIIQKKIQVYLKQRGAFCFKTHGNTFSLIGNADIICCYKGQFIGFEVKTPTTVSELTKAQKIVGRQIMDAGGLWECVWEIEKVKAVLNAIDSRTTGSKELSN